MANMVMNPRPKKFLEELPKNNYKVKPAAIKAGYSEQYADKAPKKILQTALKAQIQEAVEMTENHANISSKEYKRTLAEIIGLSREDVFKRLRYIGFEQDKDLSTASKILFALAKDEGVPIGDTDQSKTIVPILNIGVRENGLVEPHKESISEYIPIDSDANSPTS